MCGRYSFFSKDDIAEERWQAQFKLPIKRHYNAAPSQMLPVILNNDPQAIVPGQWGLIPSWMKKPLSRPLINARVETLTAKPSFRTAVRQHRCLVLADSFFEWDRKSGSKMPYRVLLKSEQPFAFAGLWEFYKTQAGVTIPTFSIITVPANDLISRLHDRMPVILQPDSEKPWLDIKSDLPAALKTLKPFPADKMAMYPISPLVNAVRNDSPKILANNNS